MTPDQEPHPHPVLDYLPAADRGDKHGAGRRSGNVGLVLFLGIYLAANLFTAFGTSLPTFLHVMSFFGFVGPVLAIAGAVAARFLNRPRPFHPYVLTGFVLAVIVAGALTWGVLADVTESI